MKVLWLCNIVLPDFSQEFGIKKNPAGGWMTGMLHELEKSDKIEISLCFPIMDEKRLKDGVCNKHRYYSFLCDMNAIKYNIELIKKFEGILKIEDPDIIHIWGTEYPHTTAMLLACKNLKVLNRAVINIQGLISFYASHYMEGIPEKYQKLKKEGKTSIEEEKQTFEKRGICEIESLNMVQYVIGRTDWDRACIKAINPKIHYYFCNEILRESFYQFAGTWKYENCRKFSIFISQASYPIKGFHYLLKALPIIMKEYPDTHINVAGTNIIDTKEKSSYAIYLEELIQELNLQNKVSFIGRINEEQMVQQYLKANVFVLPSTIENSPNSLCEARLIGVPTVASYVGGTYSGIDFAVDGYLYPFNEPVILAHYICKLFKNADGLCSVISRNSTKKILKYNSKQSNAKINMKIYDEIIKLSNLQEI